MTDRAEASLLRVENAGRDFDVSRPWLNRVIEGEPRRSLRAVDDVSFSIRKGETLGLVGESGCGKSTVARMIVGLHPPSRGRIVFDGADLADPASAPLRRRMQMIFQDPYASLNPRWRVRAIVAEPITAHGLVADRATLAARVAELLTQVGLSPEDGDKYPHEFSGGQRQRISIARALSSNPEFLVCDEPTSALDVSVQAQILNLMKDLQDRLGLTYLFISHNLAVVAHIATRVGVMYLGRLVEIADAKQLFERPRHPYTRMLIDAIPDLQMTGKARIPVAGEVPNPLDPPAGCAFNPRCPHADERCRSERPALHILASGGAAACHAVAEGRLGA
jgi:peptide/nickel transport system ATP-binding protein